MATRRGRGEGSIRKRADGRWQGSIELDRKVGDRRRKYVYGRTRQEVVARVRAVQRLADAGLPQVDERVRLGTFLDTWLEEVVKPNRDPATWRGYEANARRHIKPTLGNKQLTKLTAADVQILLNDKAAAGFAPRTVQYIHATLRAALGLAVRWDLVPRNVVIQKRAGVRHHRLYDGRHTAASLLLAQGVAPRVIMETLGHSSYSLTMDTYAHVMPVLIREAADAMDRALRSRAPS